MSERLKIIHLEDLPDDADMVARTLKKSGIEYDLLHVDNRNDFIRALDEYGAGVIISDHSLPGIDSHEALRLVKERGMEIPFILVTATVSEEYAVSIIKDGASDYILKDRLQRLPNAILASLEKYESERARRDAEEVLRISQAALVEQRVQQQRIVTETSIMVQEQERDAIGKELHDHINQILATANLYLQMGMKKSASDQELFKKSGQYIMMAIQEIRKLSHNLVAPSLGEITLKEAIEELIEDIHLTTSLRIELRGNALRDTLDPKLQLMFYRVIQEQINNVLKHAEAKAAKIEFEKSNHDWLLKISDNGKGISDSHSSNGIGLKNINNRAAFYNGDSRIYSPNGSGCVLEVRVPLQN